MRAKHLGRTPSTAGTFRKKFRKTSGKTPETLSELFLEFPSRVRLGCPKPYNSRHLRLPERFQNSLPRSTAGGASFSRIGSGKGLSELVMEFLAVLGAFLTIGGSQKVLPALLQKLFGEFLLIFGREILRESWWESYRSKSGLGGRVWRG